MVNIVGKYESVKNENFVEYLVGCGMPEDNAKQANALRPTLEFIVDNKKIILKNDSSVGNLTNEFILNEEVTEALQSGEILKTTAKLDNDTLTLTSKSPFGYNIKRIYQFTDKELVISISSCNKSAPTAKCYYKKV